MILKPVELKNLEKLEFDEEDYRRSERAVLKNLRKALRHLKGTLVDAPKEEAKIQQAIDTLKNKISDFDHGDFSSFSENPKLWQNTSRVAPKITTAVSEKKSAFEFVQNALTSFSARDYRFNPKLRKAWAEIKSAKAKHIQVRKEAKRHFLYQAKNALASKLSQSLSEKGYQKNQDNPDNLLTRLDKIKELKSRDETSEPKVEGDSILETRKECLVANLEMHKLTQEIKKLNYIENNEELNSLATQLDEITKRWIDPHFLRPSKLSTLDTVREVIKIVAIILGAGLAAVAFILLFTPLAPLSPLLGLGAMVCMAPFLDTIISAIYCKIRYARNILKSQLTEMILMPIVGVTMWLIGHIAGLFHAFKLIWNSINSYGMNALMAVSNPAYAYSLIRPLTKDPVLSKEDLKKHAAIPQEDALKIMIKAETPNKSVRLSSAAHSLWDKPTVNKEKDLPRKVNSFLFKDSEGTIRKRGSHYENIKLELALYKKTNNFSEDFAGKIQAYLDLKSGGSLSEKLGAIDAIGRDIVDNKRDDLKISGLILNEKRVLDKIKSYQFDTGNNTKASEEGHLILTR